MIKVDPDIIQICDVLQAIVSMYIRDFSEIENWFEIEDSQLLELRGNEINLWRSEAKTYKEELKSQREQLLEMGKTSLRIIRADESMYADHDRSYSKRKNTGKLNLGIDYIYPFEDNSDPIAQLDYINERLRKLIGDYSINNPPYIFREIMSQKGTRRHQAYAEMEFLVNRAEVLVGLLDRSARAVDRLHEEIDINAEKKISTIRKTYIMETNQLDLEYDDKVKAARQRFETNLQKLLSVEDLDELDKKALSCSFTSDLYKPTTSMPNSIFAGTFELEVNTTKEIEYISSVLESYYPDYVKNGTIFVLPLLLVADTSHLLFINNKDQEGITIEAIKGFICRYLLSLPVASVNCFFIDGYHSGANFKIFSPLNEVDKSIVRNEVATSTQSINSILETILKSNEDIVQKKLIGYNDLFEFNRVAESVYERYSLLVIDNFPKGFNDEAFDKLERILNKSEQCGVSVIINYNDALFTDEYGFISKKIDAIKQHMCGFWHSSGLMFPEEGDSYTLSLFRPPHNWNNLLQIYAQEVTANSTKSEPLRHLLTDDVEMFSRDSCKKLVIPFGVNGPGKIQNLVFGEGVSHSGILVGTTGAGKSTLLNSIILSAIAHYGPDELALYLLDFKEGTEFSLYSNNKVPQVRFVSVESQQELGLSILRKLCAEIDDRSEKFKTVKAKDIETYRTLTGKSMPRVLVIIDEFHVLFDLNSNYKIAEKCADYMKTLIKQGRSFGINVLISSQGIARLHDISLDNGLYAQMAVRIALKCDAEDADFMFRINPKVTETFGSVKGAGAYISDDSCKPEKFVTAFMPDNERVEFLKSVGDYYRSLGIVPKTVVYDGSKDVYFNDLLSDTNELEGVINYDDDYKIVIGESMGEVAPVVVTFNPQNKNNLLMVINNQDQARHLFETFVKCLLISKSRDSEFKTVSPFLFVLDYRIQTRKSTAKDGLTSLCEETEDIYYSKNDKGIVEVLNTLYEEYQQRELNSEEFNQPLYLVLFGLQDMNKILDTFDGEESDSDSFDEDPFAMDSAEKKSAGQIFRALLQTGSRKNIFIICWMDSVQSVKKLEYGDADYFGNKLIGKMSADDSETLIGSSLGNALTQTQLLYCDLNGETQKLKLYE